MQLVVLEPSHLPVILRPEVEGAVKGLCESLGSTRNLLVERTSRAQLEATRLDPLPQYRRSLAFVQAVFKHNALPSNIDDAIIALKDFQFEVESCQQTTELAFQQFWRVYDIVKSRTPHRQPSVSTLSSISTQIPETSTGPQKTTRPRKGFFDWFKVKSGKEARTRGLHQPKPGPHPPPGFASQPPPMPSLAPTRNPGFIDSYTHPPDSNNVGPSQAHVRGTVFPPPGPPSRTPLGLGQTGPPPAIPQQTMYEGKISVSIDFGKSSAPTACICS